MSITLLHENCPLTAADDKKLPYTAYVITYKLEGKEVHDLAIANKEVDLFDHYYDKYKKDFVTFKQAGGIANPKTWYPAGQEPKNLREREKTNGRRIWW